MIDTVDDSFLQAIKDVAEAYDADIYVYSGNIDHAGWGKVVEAFSRHGRPNALVILTTNGGLANSAYKISRFFQSQYDRFIIFIPSVCKSAGTLIAIGAHELLMSTFSELGPLDVQLYERDEIGARKSGLLSHSAFDALKEETFALYEHFMLSIKQRSADNISFPIASEVAGDMASKVMSPIFQQISPSILGSDYRDLRVAIEYGNRLAFHSENISPVAVKFLTEQYPSHDFIIDKQEAESLFVDVEGPKPELWGLIKHLKDFVFVPHEPTAVFNLNTFLEVVDDEQPDTEANGDTVTEEAGTAGLDDCENGNRDGAD
ncbi:hypothetical protein J2Z19_003284 [Ensifer adhaerens]|uniref:Uncharacterized protein n=1 Tax=Ensifer adhaerens TaxID=106592 RepID=A0ACC5SYU5_ENSAD|nr:hypothetical protein [Ensifer adhaerens]MBP1873569.1 hypothetical protein [Ensifer adhaerens]